jgi:quinol monooxygenase YgiN
MIVVTGSLVARPETLDALKARCIAHSVHSRGEPGCIAHTIHADCENPLRLFFYEVWADRAALLTHFRAPQSAAFMREARALAAQSAGPTILEASEISLP